MALDFMIAACAVGAVFWALLLVALCVDGRRPDCVETIELPDDYIFTLPQ